MLQVLNLVKRYKDVSAVDNISFTAHPGRIFGLLGPNGAGKTTTIRTILNIIKPDSGTILFNGEKIDESFNDRIGYLPEERGLYKKSRVLDIIIYFARLKNLEKSVAVEEAEKWMERLDILDLKRKRVDELSKGNQQKVQFITAVLHNPDLLVLDEPFSGFDPINQQQVKEEIDIFRSEGKVIILSTHIMETAEKLCADIFLLNKGKEVISGSLSNLKKKYASNAIRLEIEGDPELITSLPDIKNFKASANHFEIELREGYSPQEFLNTILSRVKVCHFSVSTPGLDQIFIDSIRESTTV